jgi:hypothetical protein
MSLIMGDKTFCDVFVYIVYEHCFVDNVDLVFLICSYGIPHIFAI